MMEMSTKSKVIRKKHKKKSCALKNVAIVNPSLLNGMNNWEKMQEIFGPIKTKKDSTNKTDEFITKANNFRQKNNERTSKFEQSSQSNMQGKHIEKNRTDDNLSNRSKNITNANTQEINVDRTKNDVSSPLIGMSYAEKLKRNLPVSTSLNPNPSLQAEDKKLTKVIAMDCEMVGVGPKGEDSMVARVSIVNSNGDCLYDEYVKPKLKITDFRTEVSGIRPADLKKGKELFEVQKDILRIIEGRILVGHALKHDLSVLFIDHPRQMIRDTAYYKPFREVSGGRTPALKKLATCLLGCDIQSGEHSSVEDAQAAMLLYLSVKNDWERLVKSQRRNKRHLKIIENKLEN